MGPGAASQVTARAADAQGSAERLHRRCSRPAAVRRRRHAALLHERRSAGGARRLPEPADSRFLQVPAAAVTALDQVGGGQREQLPGLLPTLRAFAIPMRNKFRGITVREGAVLRGPAGWGEFSPFAGYGPGESSRWLASAIESATLGWPRPVRPAVGVNVTVPAVGPQAAHGIVARSGCRTAKVKVAEPGQTARDDVERVAAVRDALGAQGRDRKSTRLNSSHLGIS